MPGQAVPQGPPGALPADTPGPTSPLPVSQINEQYMQQNQNISNRLEADRGYDKIDKAGDQECLRFPPFHQEMLTQTWWSAAEDFGRIKVVIAEGLAGTQGPSSGFRRLKNIVSFSFQHVPLAILEDTGIAWPNAGMWQQPSQPLYKSPTQPGIVDLDAHAHSPRRRNASATVIAPQLLSQASMLPPPARPSTMITDSSWTSAAQIHDPFLEHRAPRIWGTRVSTSDDSMPDYSHSITPGSSRHPSLHDCNSMTTELAPQQGSQFEELIDAYSSAKMSGTHAPPTTRVSSASNTPPMISNAVGLHENRAISFQSHPRSVSMTTRDAPPRAVREPSDISMRSRFSEAQASEAEAAQARIVRPPATVVKGKKEGKSSESDLLAPTGHRKAQTGSIGPRAKSNGINDGENQPFQIDSKRKRESVVSISNLMGGRVVELGSSPSRKVSRKEDKDEGVAGQEDSVRAPLGLLENIQ
ncbi:MAG: hypothetical protein Q9218_003137 [Villophora microphyllina]